VEGRELTNDRPVPDLENRALALELEVLGRRAEHGPVRHLAILTEQRVPFDGGARPDLGPVPHVHPGADDGPRADDDAFAQLRLRVDERSGMDAGLTPGADGRIAHLSTILAMNSASATTCPSTNPSPFILQVCLRYWSISSSKT